VKTDKELTDILPTQELEAIFDYQSYLQHVDEIFQRLGLTKTQWQGTMPETREVETKRPITPLES
jgi:hypothetical protein